jgi:hypothetical protein
MPFSANEYAIKTVPSCGNIETLGAPKMQHTSIESGHSAAAID